MTHELDETALRARSTLVKAAFGTGQCVHQRRRIRRISLVSHAFGLPTLVTVHRAGSSFPILSYALTPGSRLVYECHPDQPLLLMPGESSLIIDCAVTVAWTVEFETPDELDRDHRPRLYVMCSDTSRSIELAVAIPLDAMT